jgi:hypothetical protein
MTRSELHLLFVTEYAKDGLSPVPIPQEGETVELALGTVLPQSYLSFLRTHGAPFTPGILKLIVKSGRDTPDLREFLTVEEVVRNSRLYWSGGMSDQLIGFASDCMGSAFCFRRQPVGTKRPDDAEVWFFDHDYCTERALADSFDDWLLSLLKLKRPELVR